MLGKWELNEAYCTDALAMLQGLPDESVDLVVTSPPYDGLRTYNGYSFDFEPIARESFRVMKQGGVVVWVVGDSFVKGSLTLTSMRQALYFVDVAGFNMHQRIIWEQEGMPTKRPQAYMDDFEDIFILSKGLPKTFNPIMRRNKSAGEVKHKGRSGKHGYEEAEGLRTVPDESILTNIQKIGVGAATKGDRMGHPAVFPEALAERHIMTWSNPGEVVLDFFGGSGTTAKMARTLNRQWLTNDISAEYVEIIRRRLDRPFTPDMFASMEGANG